MNRLCCCCPKPGCLLQEDNFNRPDGPISGDWYGDGEIKDEILIANFDSTKICHPDYAKKGTVLARATLKNTSERIPYVMRIGDPNGSLEAEITFEGDGPGEFGALMIIKLRTYPGSNFVESQSWAWELEDERVFFCYAPNLWITAGPENRALSDTPQHVTTCINVKGEKCYERDGVKVGNFSFITGKFDDFRMEINYHDLEECQDCECYCVHKDDGYVCMNKKYYLTIESLDQTRQCINGTFEMNQRMVFGYNENFLSGTNPPTINPSAEKKIWISDPIPCPIGKDMFIVFVLECNNAKQYGYPKMIVRIYRYGGSFAASVSAVVFNFNDPDNLDSNDVKSEPSKYPSSLAYSKKNSKCKPFYLELPIFEEGYWASCNPLDTCCGGYVCSGDIGPGITDGHYYMKAYITE